MNERKKGYYINQIRETLDRSPIFAREKFVPLVPSVPFNKKWSGGAWVSGELVAVHKNRALVGSVETSKGTKGNAPFGLDLFYFSADELSAILDNIK